VTGAPAAGGDGVEVGVASERIRREMPLPGDRLTATNTATRLNSVRGLSRRHVRLASGASTKSDYGIMDDLRLGAELQ
jgi:hypothetical protein